MDNKYGIHYEDRPTEPPLMVFWHEDNAALRQMACEKGLNEGNVSKQTLHQKMVVFLCM